LRNKRLDILRAIAVLLVLGRHGDGPTLWRSAGWVGVDLLFVLSGFLISGLLFSEYKKTGGIDCPETIEGNISPDPQQVQLIRGKQQSD
jgi:peptidoglycan/LPS O-acetylase OafA/YrhL